MMKMKKVGASMAINVEFFTCNDDPRTLNKTLTPVLNSPVSAVLTANTSILQPILLIQYNGAVCGANYMYIPHFQRYYTIENITVTEGERMTITGASDPVHTKKTELLNCVGNCIRNEGLGIGFVPDTMIPIDPCTEFVSSEYFSESDIDETSQMGDYYYVLTLKGGAV